jgi:hypothetical protein
MNQFERTIESAPEGHATIAQRFNVGTGVLRRTSPEGTADGSSDLTRAPDLSRPFGTYLDLAVRPNVETLGYYQTSLWDELRNSDTIEQKSLRTAKRVTPELLPLTGLLFLTGCKAAPSINLVGSFFPAWMLCVAIGVFGVLILRRVFVRTEIETHLGALPLVYFCLWVLITLGSWLLFFRG